MKSNRPLPSPQLLVVCLMVLAGLSAAVGLTAALAVGLLAVSAGRAGQATAGWMVLFGMAGCCVGAALWALAWLCHRRHLDGVAQRQLARALASMAERRSAPALPTERAADSTGHDKPAPAQTPEALLAELRELNVNLLLSDEQRCAKRKHLLSRQADALAGMAAEAVEAEDLPEAQRRFDRLMGLAPDDPRAGALAERIDALRRTVQRRDIAAATERASELMSAGQYAQAVEVAAALAARHPDGEGVAALAERVGRERAAFEAEDRKRMFARVEKEAAGRRWRAAKAAAEELLETYGDSPEAGEVRSNLPTIADNAHIEEARELRDRISDLLRRRRFAEAVAKARDLIARFPDTTAAAELNKEMPRLEKLAGGEEEAGAD